MSNTFKGGVHPKGFKDLSKHCETQKLAPKGDLCFILNAHLGAPALPIVSVGERVLVGQKIAEAQGFISASVVASCSGVVKAVGSVVNAFGDEAPAITVENDFLYEAVDGFGEEREFSEFENFQILKIIADAGIVGMGGAGFPAAAKLATDKPIDTVIINCAECEPYITADYRLMLESPEKAVLGAKVLAKLFLGARIVFAVEDNKKDAAFALQGALTAGYNMAVQLLKTKYPQGAERSIIYAVTGRKLNSSKLPADIGCLVINLATACAVADAVCCSTPLVSRVVTVTGDAVATPCNLVVPIGTAALELIEACGGLTCDPEKIIFGGPMMGNSVASLNAPITKTTSCILCLKDDHVDNKEPSECIRCGRCLTVCPSGLMPHLLKNLADRYDYTEFESCGGLECVSCGSCTYICPAKRRLSQSITVAKNYVRNEKRKKGVK